MKEPPKLPNQDQAEKPSEEIEGYQKVADTVGMVPSLRMKDNLWQGIIIGVCILIGVPIGYFIWGSFGALAGLLAGLVLGGLGSGTVLMIKGWKRALRK